MQPVKAHHSHLGAALQRATEGCRPPQRPVHENEAIGFERLSHGAEEVDDRLVSGCVAQTACGQDLAQDNGKRSGQG